MAVSNEKKTELYYKMVLTRCFEEKAQRLFAEGKVHGTAHFCIGEEATGVGMCSALEPEDYISQTHRGHNQAIGKGMDPKIMMAEFLGKATGYCKGKGGCMHIADSAVGSLGANGIVGGGIPLAVGAALKQKLSGDPNITVCFFGDGASNEGSFHESLNLASVWKLPVIFVCVNNLYGMSTHISKSMNITDISVRAAGYGIRGESMDGNDVLSIYESTLEWKDYVRRSGPLLAVLNTYRWVGHSKSDANVYRTKDEIESWKEKCPIKRLRTHLLSKKTMTGEELDALDAQAAREIEDVYRYAEESPEPKLESALEDVYA
jgi:acetoin:2,6-dichlorophenolindophenol oxidoreductase subunit alpha